MSDRGRLIFSKHNPMLNPPTKLCRSCTERPPHTGRRECLVSIHSKLKDFAMEQKTKSPKAVKIRTAKKVAKTKNPKKPTVAKLKAKLWTLFSQYIRTLHLEWDIATCVTCGVQKHWKEQQAGHYIPAGSSNYLRFHEKNVHVQCYVCNCMKHSNPIEYRIFMVNTYGENFVDTLVSLRNEPKKFTVQELLEMIDEYQAKLISANV